MTLEIEDAERDQAGQGAFRCTPSQTRFWFLHQLEQGSSALNVIVRWEIRGRRNPVNIEQAFRQVIHRHEILRTRFVEIDGEPFQEIAEVCDFRLSVIDLTMLPAVNREQQADALARVDASAPFDLRKAPLIRATLVQIEERRAMLQIVAHHCVFDAWSIGVLGRDLGATIAALDAKSLPELPELPLQFGDYAMWLQEYMTSRGLEVETKYWQRQLADAPYFEVKADGPRPARRGDDIASVSAVLPRQLGERVEAVAKQHGVSVFTLGCSVLAAALRRHTGLTDIVVGTQVAGRDQVDLEELVGVFINELVLRVDSGCESFGELVKRTDAVVRDALIHQHMPFHKLVEVLNPPRDPSRMPLVCTQVVIQRAFMEDSQFGDHQIVSIPSSAVKGLYDLSFQMIGRANCWRLSVEYNCDLFHTHTAEHLLSLWQETLGRALSQHDFALSTPTRQGSPSEAAKAEMMLLATTQKVLMGHPDVKEAVVVPGAGTDHSHAYVVPSETNFEPLEALPEKLAAHLAQVYPQVTIGISVLLDLPRKPDGTLNRARLPCIERSPPPDNHSADAEKRLLSIWQNLLGTDRIQPHDNFFTLGGHSLLAVRMLTQVRNAFGIQLDLNTLFGSPSFAAFAKKVVPRTEEETSVDYQIIKIQSQGHLTPVIAINDAYFLYELSRKLGPERRCFGVTIFDSRNPRELPDRPFEDIARDYVAAIQKEQPRGPYILFGHCAFGVLAMEIATQLRGRGEIVELVAAINSWAPQYSESLSTLGLWMLRVHDLHWNFLRFVHRKTSLLGFLGRWTIVRKLFLQRAVAWGLLKALPPKSQNAEADWFLMHVARAREKYQAKAFQGDLLLFLGPTVPKGRLFDPSLGWGSVVSGRCDVHRVPSLGENGLYAEGFVNLVAEQMRTALESADRRHTQIKIPAR